MRRLLALALLMICGAPAFANDSMATLGAGGLVFVQTSDVKMVREDLYVSPYEVRVSYQFRNESDTDADTLVAFPLPDIEGSGDFMVAIPGDDPENPFGFETEVNGEPVAAELHQYAFATNIDHTAYLKSLGIPLLPFGIATFEAIAALDEATQRELFARGLVVPMQYYTDAGELTEYYPVWTVKTTYSWTAHFPAGETVTVAHRYRPSVGGTVAVTFLADPYGDYDPAALYRTKYCTDDGFVAAVERTLPDPTQRYGAPFTESWLSYVWSTGANWNGAIGTFHLTIDKGAPENLVSFCWDGEVTKTSPTTFEMEATDWYPPYGRELEILLLNRQNQLPANVG